MHGRCILLDYGLLNCPRLDWSRLAGKKRESGPFGSFPIPPRLDEKLPCMFSIRRLLQRCWTVSYKPNPANRQFEETASIQTRDGFEIRVAVPDAGTVRAFFGVPLARRGIQPVWIRITNQTDHAWRLQCIAVDPNYFSPLEAAARNHFSDVKRLLGFGLLAWVYLPVILLLMGKLFAVRKANRRMDAYFQQHAFHLRPVPAGGTQAGFVFTNRTEGTKRVPIRLLGTEGIRDFEFSIPIPGLDTDHLRRELKDRGLDNDGPELSRAEFREHLENTPPATTDHRGKRLGDPLNLVIVGDFATILGAFGARWDETEVISLVSCWKTFRAFLTGAEYRYSPVSPLYLFQRSQDFALQRIRDSINQRLHLRLWNSGIRYAGKPVWIGQASRDIGVRFTWRTWNLTTHRIDADVDEARDYVLEDLINAGRVQLAGYVPGVGSCEPCLPRRNLTGDPYFTDGQRAVVILSETTATPTLLDLMK